MPAPTTTVSQASISGSPARGCRRRRGGNRSRSPRGLGHMGGEQARIAARRGKLSRHPRRTPGGEFFFRDVEVEPPGLHVERDLVARLDQCERPSGERLGRDVQHAGPVGRAGHARVGDPDHVADARLQQLLRDREHSPLRHTRPAQRTRVAQDEDRIRRDVQRRIVNPRGHVVVVLENDRRARVGQQLRRRGGVLDDAAVRRQRAVEDREAALGEQRIRDRPDHVVVVDNSTRKRLQERIPGHRCRVFQVEAGHHAAQAACLEEVLHEVLARRPDVRQHRGRSRELVESVQSETPPRPGPPSRPGG